MRRLLTILVCLIILPITLLAQSDFPVANSTNQEHEPAVAYNSFNDEYLVVWSEMAPIGMGNYLFGGVYGQRFSSSGQKEGSLITIFDQATSPSVAYNSKLNIYAVAAEISYDDYYLDEPGIHTQRISSSGVKIGDDIRVDHYTYLPQILYNDLSDEYIVASSWSQGGNTGISLKRMSGDFLVYNTEHSFTPDSSFSITYAPIRPNGQYLLSESSRFHRLLNYELNTIKTITLETGYPKGGYVDGEGYASLLNSEHAIVDVAFGYKDGKAVFMVVYADNNNKWIWPEREGVTTELLCGVWGGYIDAENPPDQVTDSYFPIGDWLLERNCSAKWKPKVVYNDVAKKFIVVWNEFPTNASTNNVKEDHIRATDKFANDVGFVNTVLSTTNGTEKPDYPVIATSTQSNKAFVVWEDHRNSGTNDIDLYGSMYSFTITPPPSTVPDPPDGLVAILSPPNTINLTWSDNSDNEDEFHIERKDPESGLWGGIGIVGSNTTSFSDPGLELGKTFYYRVRAKNSIGFSTYSNEAHATTSSTLPIPSAPSNLTATLNPPNTIDLAWNDNSTNEDAFHVERKESASGSWSEIGVLGANTTSLTDPGLGRGITYYYRVRANNSYGYSAYSNEAHAKTNSGVPAAPSNLTASLSPPNTIDLTWSDNSAIEDNYHIERKESASGTWSEIGVLGANTTSYADPGLGGEITYYYRVRAKNSFGFSPYSNEASATTNSTAPSITVVSPNGGEVWTVGSQQEIKWTSTNFTGNVRIDIESGWISGGSVVYRSLFVVGPNDGSYMWTIEMADLILGDTPFYCRIRVSDAAKNPPGQPEDGKIFDWSDDIFTILGPSITVISPNGGESWQTGSQQEIKWTSSDFTGPVRIDCEIPWIGGGVIYRNLSQNTPNDGSFIWTVDDFSIHYSFPCKIRVADATKRDPGQSEDRKGFDWSDDYFTVILLNNTGVGTDVVVHTGNNAWVLFKNVTGAGTTTMSKKSTGTPPPDGFQLVPIGAGVYYEINTTATYTGNIEIMLSYDGTGLTMAQHLSLKLLVYEDPPGNWKDITTARDPSNCWIYGTIDHLSEFAIMLPTSGGTIVTNTDDSGPGSLREAISLANSNVGMDTILFNIPKNVPGYYESLGVWTIEPQTPLPTITDEGLLIDGFSQSEFIGEDTNPDGPEIQLLGSNAGDYAFGLNVKASYVDVFGLAINDFKGTGIFVEGAEGGKISGCYVGCGVRGDVGVANSYGIILSRTRNYLVAPIDTLYNVISGNTNVGIMVADTSYHNEIAGNVIGLDKNRGEAIPNENYGGINITFESDSNYVVDNLISGNSTGVNISSSDNNLIQNNLIGTNYEWIALGNEDIGIYVSEGAQGNLIKENVIAFNGGSGVFVRGSETKFNTITRTSIGFNESWGIRLDNGANESIAAPQLTSASLNNISGTAPPNSIVEVFTDPDLQGIFFHDSTVADASGNFTWSGTIESEFTNITATATDVNGNTSMFSAPMVVTSIDEVSEKPESYAVSQNYPNPFNPSTIIMYSLPEKTHVMLSVYDVLGREIEVLVNREQEVGNYEVVFDASNLTSGVYFYKIMAGDFVETKKMLLIR